MHLEYNIIFTCLIRMLYPLKDLTYTNTFKPTTQPIITFQHNLENFIYT